MKPTILLELLIISALLTANASLVLAQGDAPADAVSCRTTARCSKATDSLPS
jgi:hypothetical protein